MPEYIFYTTEGFTQTPDGSEVENCQVLGTASGKSREEAKRNLLNENPWIEQKGFNSACFIVKQIMIEDKISPSTR